MKSRTRPTKAVNDKNSFATNGRGSRQRLHMVIIVFLLLLSIGQSTPVAQAQIRAYVANAGTNTVSVIDTASNTVVATIPVGIFPDAVAVTPDGTRAYVANKGTNTVSVINTATKTVSATVAGLLVPDGVAITPDGTRAYVTN